MGLIRQTLLAASTNAWLREQATRRAFVRKSVSRFMPGERIEDAIDAAVRLKSERIGTILTRLGENLASLDEAEEVTAHYIDVIDRIRQAGLDGQVSVKPTQLGFDLDPDVCTRNLLRIVEHADRSGVTPVWIDMESSPYVDPTLKLFRAARERSRGVGVALQAYLYRTAKDVEDLLPLGPAIRIVKGAYLEPANLPRKPDVDDNYFRLCTRLLDEDSVRRGTLLHIATHDAQLADRLARVIDERRVPTASYEFAMLYGIQRAQQQRLAASGRRLRVLISYGEHWFPWYMRRLAERPANIGFVVRNLFS